MRFIIRHLALKPYLNLSAQEWQNLIGPSPSVENLLKRLVQKRSQQRISKQFESVFGARVEI
jgi:hypothetical protein